MMTFSFLCIDVDGNISCPQAQSKISIAEAETADANAKPRKQTQNSRRAGGKSCGKKNILKLRKF